MRQLANQVFGKLTVIKDSGQRHHRKIMWECLCSCGNTKIVRADSLVSGLTTSCGCNVGLNHYKTKIASVGNTCPPVPPRVIDNYNYYNDIKTKLLQVDSTLDFRYDVTCKNTDVLICDSKKVVINFIDVATKNQEFLMKTFNLTQVQAKKFIYDIMVDYSNKGYRVITIFENEWLDKQYKMFNFLKSVMGCNNITVYARKCSVKEIDKTTGRDFLKQEHIQGCANLSTKYFGLYSNDTNDLLAVISFGHHHREQSIFSNNNTTVLDRFAVKSGYNIPGCGSKLLKYAIDKLKQENKTQIVSWSDKRISAGNLYRVLGFTLHQDLNPDYSYWNSSLLGCVVEGKQKNKKCNLKLNGVPVLQTNYTEYEATLMLKKYRIWDTGKSVWVLSI